MGILIYLVSFKEKTASFIFSVQSVPVLLAFGASGSKTRHVTKARMKTTVQFSFDQHKLYSYLPKRHMCKLFTEIGQNITPSSQWSYISSKYCILLMDFFLFVVMPLGVHRKQLFCRCCILGTWVGIFFNCYLAGGDKPCFKNINRLLKKQTYEDKNGNMNIYLL